MLHIPLAPSPITTAVGQHVCRGLVKRTRWIHIPLHCPSCAGQQGGLNNIMAQDIATQRWFARQCWKVAMSCERSDADKGIMSPIDGISAIEPVLPHRKN